jgi:hypothetical protein
MLQGNWGNAGTFTPGASNTVIFNGNNSTQTLTGSTSFTNLTSNHTGMAVLRQVAARWRSPD